MNSLDNYKDQVYNIGSPSPNPSKSPLKNLPKTVEKEFDFSEEVVPNTSTVKPKRKNSKTKLPKVPGSSAAKRKLDREDNLGDSPPKRVKMMTPEMFEDYLKKVDEKNEKSKKESEEFFSKSLAKFESRFDDLAKDTDESITKGLSKFDRRLDGLASKLDKVIVDNAEASEQVKTEITGMKEQVSGLQASVDDQRVKFENKLVELEGNFDKLSESVISASNINTKEIMETLVPLVKDEVIATVKKEVKDEVLPPVKATWNAIQAQKVFEHEHSMLVLGLQADKPPMEAAENLLRNDLKVSNENMFKISVKKAIRLGKAEGNKIPPLLVTFGHPSERNLVLGHSKNLKGTRVSLKKSVPDNYREAFKRFEDQSFKLRNMPGLEYQAQIVFDGHLMLLRTKCKDTVDNKYHYTTYSKFEPPMETDTDKKSNIKTPSGTKTSPIPDSSVLSKANASLYMSVKGMKDDITEENFKKELLAYLKEEHRNFVVDFTKKKSGLAIIFCNSWESANTIATTYTNKFMNNSVSFTLFCAQNPDI